MVDINKCGKPGWYHKWLGGMGGWLVGGISDNMVRVGGKGGGGRERLGGGGRERKGGGMLFYFNP